MVLPCSPGDFGQCVSGEQAKSLFEAGDWSFHHKYTFKVQSVGTGGGILGYSRPCFFNSRFSLRWALRFQQN